MNYKSILIDQLTACYNDKSWFIPLQETLIDVTAVQARWKMKANNQYGRL
ncbi:hypothetical protein LJK88_26400 [Paenibacillus sp. P26]|nr:hypothetical protein LJK88_26400 [Paenibacillus sp. P26]